MEHFCVSHPCQSGLLTQYQQRRYKLVTLHTSVLSALDLSSLLPSIEKRVNVLDKCFKNKNLKIKIYFYSKFSTTISFSITDPFVFDAVFSERTIKNI